MAAPTASGGFMPIEVPTPARAGFVPIEVTPVDQAVREVLVTEPARPRTPKPDKQPAQQSETPAESGEKEA